MSTILKALERLEKEKQGGGPRPGPGELSVVRPGVPQEPGRRWLWIALLARPSAGDGGSEPRSSWLDTNTGCSKKMPAMPDGPGTALVTRTKWVRVPPPALAC